MNTFLSGLLCGLIWGVSGIIGFFIESKREKYNDISQAPEEFTLCLMFGCVSLVIMCIRELFIFIKSHYVTKER